MAVPTRIFVGVFVFSLIAALAVVPFSIMVLGDYQPPTSLPLVSPTTQYDTADKVAFGLASLFATGFVIASWRALLHGARRQAAVRQEREDVNSAVEVGGDGGRSAAQRGQKDAGRRERAEGATGDRGDGPPPGYG